ncbi:unnamed protein product [Closterium sp. Naga37s-1]|nr:unnamed protein product [Closterium sp. Naga37s-1]
MAIMVRYNLQSSGASAVLQPCGHHLPGLHQPPLSGHYPSRTHHPSPGFINFVVPTLLFHAAFVTYPTPEEIESRGYLLIYSSHPSSTPLSATPHTSTPLRRTSSADRSLVGLIHNVIAALSPMHSANSSEGGAGVMEIDMEGAGAYKQMPDSVGGEVEDQQQGQQIRGLRLTRASEATSSPISSLNLPPQQSQTVSH